MHKKQSDVQLSERLATLNHITGAQLKKTSSLKSLGPSQRTIYGIEGFKGVLN